jgi:hypothetical protein
MFTPPLVSDDVPPMEANLDRMYWACLLNGRMMPGLGMAAQRLATDSRAAEMARRTAPEITARLIASPPIPPRRD